jgi:hypothetical protein
MGLLCCFYQQFYLYRNVAGQGVHAYGGTGAASGFGPEYVYQELAAAVGYLGMIVKSIAPGDKTQHLYDPFDPVQIADFSPKVRQQVKYAVTGGLLTLFHRIFHPQLAFESLLPVKNRAAPGQIMKINAEFLDRFINTALCRGIGHNETVFLKGAFQIYHINLRRNIAAHRIFPKPG